MFRGPSHGDAEPFMYARSLDGVTDDMRGSVDLHHAVRAFKLDVVQIVAGHQVPYAFAGIGLRVDDVPCADTLQNARMLLGHRLRPNVGDARVQQIAGGDDGRFDAVADGYDRRVEIGGVDLLQRHHVGHVGLHGGDLRRPAVHQFAVLVDGEHILAHRIQCGGYGTAETAESYHKNASGVVSHDCSRTFRCSVPDSSIGSCGYRNRIDESAQPTTICSVG